MSQQNSTGENSYEHYINCVTMLLDGAIRDPDALEVGVNISDTPEVKIMFDDYGDDGEDTNSESYAVFIHKDALNDDFEFPEHDKNQGFVINRREEVIIWAWYDVDNELWNITTLEELDWESTDLSSDLVMEILNGLKNKYRPDDE